ncbi:MAG: hypothetical protein JXR10_00555 [Cyclobacteriaceae bacterium]
MRYLFFLILATNAFFAKGLDSVMVSQKQILILKDTIIAPISDTVIFLSDIKYKVRTNPYKSSSEFYRKIKEKTGQNKVTAQIFDLLYVNKKESSEQKSKNSRTSNQPFEAYKGLKVTNIRIKFVDILEGSVSDTLRIASSSLAKVANQFHINSWSRLIRNNLLVKVNDVIDPYAMADNERILRRLRFVEDAKIYVTKKNDGEADLIVVIKDRISWGTALDIYDYNQFRAELFNRNIGGSGKSASIAWLYDDDNEPSSGYSLSFGAQNISKTITSWEINHSKNLNNQTWGLNLQKEFVAPEIKYGGGLEVRWLKDTILFLDKTPSAISDFELNFQDIWLGRSFQIASSNSRKNIIISARYLNHAFSQQPYVSEDSNFLFFNRKLLLSELSLSNRKFLKTNYISGYGISEDIPLGYRFSFITGYDFNEYYTQQYIGYQLFWAFYVNNFGYLLFNQEIGAFNRNSLQNGSFKIKLNYFTPLMHIGRYYFRSFARLSYSRGISQPEYRSINLKRRIRDLEGDNISGNSAFGFAIESVMFTPWYFYGFRFAPFIYYNFGEVWDTRTLASAHYAYQGTGLGVRIKNESLVFNTLELRVTQFIKAPINSDKTQFSLSATIPISFENIFKYKPVISAFD